MLFFLLGFVEDVDGCAALLGVEVDIVAFVV